MYAVVCYYNYRKEVFFTVLKTFKLLKNAVYYALRVAEERYGSELVEGVEEQYVSVNGEVIDGYTVDTGYGRNVYTVIKMDEPEDKDEEENQQENNECIE